MSARVHTLARNGPYEITIRTVINPIVQDGDTFTRHHIRYNTTSDVTDPARVSALRDAGLMPLLNDDYTSPLVWLTVCDIAKFYMAGNVVAGRFGPIFVITEPHPTISHDEIITFWTADYLPDKYAPLYAYPPPQVDEIEVTLPGDQPTEELQIDIPLKPVVSILLRYAKLYFDLPQQKNAELLAWEDRSCTQMVYALGKEFHHPFNVYWPNGTHTFTKDYAFDGHIRHEGLSFKFTAKFWIEVLRGSDGTPFYEVEVTLDNFVATNIEQFLRWIQEGSSMSVGICYGHQRNHRFWATDKTKELLIIPTIKLANIEEGEVYVQN
jgi:hypothetical protein